LAGNASVAFVIVAKVLMEDPCNRTKKIYIVVVVALFIPVKKKYIYRDGTTQSS
jgi:hypothetical protein